MSTQTAIRYFIDELPTELALAEELREGEQVSIELHGETREGYVIGENPDRPWRMDIQLSDRVVTVGSNKMPDIRVSR